ncbi:MAG: hypothetical protein HXY34_02810 [Candidatus Thorarchaeota archaeon]|nr:hypothetical protein [Candidatus Thorarchaeota archaeon]
MKPNSKEVRRVECTQPECEVELGVGEEFYYQFHRHGSVGEETEFSIDRTDIVRHEKTSLEYVHPDRVRPGWTGGDMERGEWFFKAIKAGTARLTIRELFRGRLENERVLILTVKQA